MTQNLIQKERVAQALQAVQNFCHRHNGPGMTFVETVSHSIDLHQQNIFSWIPKNKHDFQCIIFYKVRQREGKWRFTEVINSKGLHDQVLTDELNGYIRNMCDGKWLDP